MTISEIKEEKGIYTVTLMPNRFEKFFGKKPNVLKFKDSGIHYLFGSGTVYIKENGEKLPNRNYIGEAIDVWRRKQAF